MPQYHINESKVQYHKSPLMVSGSFEDMPHELWLRILKFLSFCEWVNLMRVCKRIHMIAQNNILWKDYYPELELEDGASYYHYAIDSYRVTLLEDDVLPAPAGGWERPDPIISPLSQALSRERNYFIILRNVARKSASSLRFVDSKYRFDPDIAIAAIHRRPSDWQYVSSTLKGNKSFMLHAIQKHKITLNDASDLLKNDQDIVVAALCNNIDDFQYASRELQDNKTFVLALLKRRIYAIQIAAKRSFEIIWAKKRYDEHSDLSSAILQFLKEERRSYNKVFKCCSNKLRADSDVAIAAIENHGAAIISVSPQLERYKDWVAKAAYYQYDDAIHFPLEHFDPGLFIQDLEIYKLYGVRCVINQSQRVFDRLNESLLGPIHPQLRMRLLDLQKAGIRSLAIALSSFNRKMCCSFSPTPIPGLNKVLKGNVPFTKNRYISLSSKFVPLLPPLFPGVAPDDVVSQVDGMSREAETLALKPVSSLELEPHELEYMMCLNNMVAKEEKNKALFLECYTYIARFSSS